MKRLLQALPPLVVGLTPAVALYVWSLTVAPSRAAFFAELGWALPTPTALALSGWAPRLVAVASAALLLLPGLLRAPAGLSRGLALVAPWVAILGLVLATWSLRLPLASCCSH